MRSRVLRPGFFENEELALLGSKAQILFAGLWCFADREGRFKWIPKLIKAKVFPYTQCNVPQLLDTLAASGFVIQYSVNGKEYGYIPTFLEHQRIHPRESRSKLPSYEEGEPRDSPGQAQGEPKDNQRLPTSTSTSTFTYPPKFENLWDYYPRKIEKKAAYKKYQATLQKGVEEHDLLKATQNYAKAMAGKEMQHIKHGATFFGPTEPWREWTEGSPEDFNGVLPEGRAEDPHKDVRCVRCLSWWTTMEKDEDGHCENCQRELYG
jgi:hypothetical protein